MFSYMEHGVVHKTFLLLEALASTPGDQTLGEIAAKTELPKSTTHRILKDLVGLGYVSWAEPGIYRLSEKFKGLAHHPTDRWLAELGQPVLKDLYEAIGGETVNLGVLRQDKVVYVAIIESSHALRRFVEVDEAQPYYISALGRSIVAYLPPQRREYLLSRTRFRAFTPSTVTDPGAFRRLLQQIRKQGYAVEKNQADEGVGCVSAPVFNGGNVVAAISMTCPLARLGDDQLQRFIVEVRAAAEALSRQMTQHDGDEHDDGEFAENHASHDAGQAV